MYIFLFAYRGKNIHFIINIHPCFLDAPERFPRHCPWNLCRRPRRSSAGSLKGYVCVCLEVSTRAIRFWSVLSFFAWIRALKKPAMIRLKIIRFLLFSCGLISWELGFVYLYITWSRAGYGYTTLVLQNYIISYITCFYRFTNGCSLEVGIGCSLVFGLVINYV